MKCTTPPESWYCTRENGHEGPCAALPKLSVMQRTRRALLIVALMYSISFLLTLFTWAVCSYITQ